LPQPIHLWLGSHGDKQVDVTFTKRLPKKPLDKEDDAEIDNCNEGLSDCQQTHIKVINQIDKDGRYSIATHTSKCIVILFQLCY